MTIPLIAAPPSAPAVITGLYASLASSLEQAAVDATTITTITAAWSGYTQTQINSSIETDLLPIMGRLVAGTLALGNAVGAITNYINAAPR